jgi:hypothetical protein
MVWSVLVLGLVLGFALIQPSHAAADTNVPPGANGYGCGVMNPTYGRDGDQQAAGLVVDVKWQKYGEANQREDTSSRVQVTTHGYSYKPPHTGGIAQMSPDDSTELSLNQQETFDQVPAGCSGMGDNMGVVLGYGKTSPDGGGYYHWALDCEETDRAAAGLGFNNPSNVFQPYDITGVGVPAGARAGGTWSTETVQPVNGTTAYVTVVYTEPPPPNEGSGTCTYFTTTGSKYVRKEVHITGVSSGLGKADWNGTTWTHSADFDEYTPAPVGQNVSPGSYQKEWWYRPTANVIHVTVNEWDYNSANNTWPETSNSYDVSCYSATCSINSVDGDGPGGIVLAGGTMHVHGTFTNTSPPPDSLTMWAGAFLDGPNGANNLGFVPYSGYPVDFTLDLPAPSAVQPYGASFTPQYNGSESNMSGCSMSAWTYQQFNAQVAAQSNPSPTIENPSSDSYGATISHQWVNPPAGMPGHGINNPVSASFYQKKAGGGQTTPCSPSSYSSSGPYNVPSPSPPGYDTIWSNNCAIAPGSFTAGDEFCSTVTATYGSGYVGPDNNVVFGGPSTSDTKCPRVVNEPYFKVYHSDISAGGEFDKCTTNGGTLAGYADISDPSGATRGSTTQLSALALLKITGVASAKTSADITGSPTKLSFANTGVQVDSSGNESPVLGGQFGGCRTLTNETAPASATNYSGPMFVVNPAKQGAYTHTGNITIKENPPALGANQNMSLFVDGNVYISSDITYDDGWGAGTAPSFIVHATGNIYIDPGVKQLSGVYIAQQKTKSDGTPDTTTGKIYTCADSTGFAPMSAANLYNGCKNQLVVYGSFVADQINLMRSLGSLRDEIPNPGSPGIGTSAGVWSHAGNPSSSGESLRCTQILEPGEPDSHTWKDNYLCVPTSSTLQMAWTYYAGNPDRDNEQAKDVGEGRASIAYLKSHGYPACTLWNATPGWEDNYLCLNQDIGLTFGTNSNPPGQACLKVDEPADPDGQWSTGYFLCAPFTGPTPPTPKGPPFISCSNKGTETDTNSCAGEIFEYSPALYLSNGGGTTQPPGGGSLQLQSITSLPPVL